MTEMYTPGLLRIAPAGCKLDEEGDCEDMDHEHPGDSRARYSRLFGGVFLPHSCDYWVVGGPAEIRALIDDLQAALVVLEQP